MRLCESVRVCDCVYVRMCYHCVRDCVCETTRFKELHVKTHTHERMHTLTHTDANAIALHTDVTSAKSIHRAVSAVIKRFGRIDVLVNCVGWTNDALFIRKPRSEWVHTQIHTLTHTHIHTLMPHTYITHITHTYIQYRYISHDQMLLSIIICIPNYTYAYIHTRVHTRI